MCDVLQHPCWFVFLTLITDSTLWDCQSTGKFEKCVFLFCKYKTKQNYFNLNYHQMDIIIIVNLLLIYLMML